jgi:hypothetical protein
MTLYDPRTPDYASDRFAFNIAYDEKTLRRAVSGFVTSAIFRENAFLTHLPLALIVLACGALYFTGEEELGVELFVGVSVLLAIFVFSGWRMHMRQLRARLAGGGGRHPLVRLREEGLVIESGPAAPMIEWPRIREIRTLEDVWLLTLETNHFIVLPVRGAPREALRFLQDKVLATRAATAV